MRRSDLVHNDQHAPMERTTQIVFGERQHLLRVLDSLEGSHLSPGRRNHERRVLEELIHARTKELNETNSSWDEKVGMVLSAEANSGSARQTGQAGAQIGFLPAAADQRASSSLFQDAGPLGASFLRRHTRERRAPSQCRAGHAGHALSRPHPAALVPGGLQSQHSRDAAPPVAGPSAEAGRTLRNQVENCCSDPQSPLPRLGIHATCFG